MWITRYGSDPYWYTISCRNHLGASPNRKRTNQSARSGPAATPDHSVVGSNLNAFHFRRIGIEERLRRGQEMEAHRPSLERWHRSPTRASPSGAIEPALPLNRASESVRIVIARALVMVVDLTCESEDVGGPLTRPGTQLRFGIFQSESLGSNLDFSPRGEAKRVRGPSGRGASRLARANVLVQYAEQGKQAPRSHGGLMACFVR